MIIKECIDMYEVNEFLIQSNSKNNIQIEFENVYNNIHLLHRVARKFYSKRTCEICGLVEGKRKFDMHCHTKPKDYNKWEKRFWFCVCPKCHYILEKQLDSLVNFLNHKNKYKKRRKYMSQKKTYQNFVCFACKEEFYDFFVKEAEEKQETLSATIRRVLIKYKEEKLNGTR